MLEVHERPVKPLLRYHGGKWLASQKIIPFFPPHRDYVEPFCGGASVLLRKERSYREVVNDLDSELITLFRVLQDRQSFQELDHRLTYTPFSREEYELAFQQADEPVEVARRVLIRSWMGHGTSSTSFKTGFRTNLRAPGRNPAGEWPGVRQALPIVVNRLTGVTIEHKDAIDCMVGHDTEETLFYVDPPYLASTRSHRKRYRHEMQDDDSHRRLAHCLKSLKGMVVLSGYHDPLYDELYDGWQYEMFDGHADMGKARTECLWLSPRAKEKLDEYTLPPLLAAINETY